MKLKMLFGYAIVALLGLLFTLPAAAQSPAAEAELRNWMARDPRLEADPDLMLNPGYLHNHPRFAEWLQQHPGVHEQIAMMGAYDERHVWHPVDWWRTNNPNWIYAHHPEWIRAHPEWRQYGDWDEHHMWHDRDWWAANHADWVAAHHPEWQVHHEAVVEHHEAQVEHHEAQVEHHEAQVEHHEAQMEHHDEHVPHHEEHLEHHEEHLEHHP